MNGAIADPCVSTIRAPNTANTTNTGISQNFLLTFRNVHSSEINDSIAWYLDLVRIDSSSVEADLPFRSNRNPIADPV